MLNKFTLAERNQENNFLREIYPGEVYVYEDEYYRCKIVVMKYQGQNRFNVSECVKKVNPYFQPSLTFGISDSGEENFCYLKTNQVLLKDIAEAKTYAELVEAGMSLLNAADELIKSLNESGDCIGKAIKTDKQAPWNKYLEINETTGERSLVKDTPDDVRKLYEEYIKNQAGSDGMLPK